MLSFSENISPSIDMTGWVFAFPVQMGAINVEDETDEHQELTAVINQPGGYSILRLYLDFNSKLCRTVVNVSVN